jgi:hypothetical protein
MYQGSDPDIVKDQTSKSDQKDTECNSEDEHDSVLDDNGEEDVFNNENEGDDKHRPRKSVMLSRNMYRLYFDRFSEYIKNS